MCSHGQVGVWMGLRRLRRAETAGVGHGGGGERKSEETEEKEDQSDDIYLKRRFRAKGCAGAWTRRGVIFCREQCWLDTRSG